MASALTPITTLRALLLKQAEGPWWGGPCWKAGLSKSPMFWLIRNTPGVSAWIFVIQAVAYYGKLAIHPAPMTTLADLWERAAIGAIPGGLVVVAGVLFHGAWAVLALVTYRIEIASRRERRSLIAM